ncbi:MAG TPA: chloride channel protein [Anaeromyxobacteraceae bacterium]|nr:chloride channel protein [Anaeromyxobacteraceae bacterium]
MIPSQAREVLRVVARLTEGAPLDLRLLGRTVLHAALVGVVAGLVGAAFFAGLELGQRLLVEDVAGFTLLRARGEAFVAPALARQLRPLWLVLLPALGGLASGLLTTWLAPEAAGGGGEATIQAYHRTRPIRGRVIPVKGIASILALSSGGSGGREGPTMQIGAAIGALVGRLLPASRSERRVLVVAGVAAGISAVFRTPLGAALLATEMLYRDDFEADALVPSILASVVSYSVVIALFGETTLFGALPRFPFTPAHLPLYAALALAIALAGIAFVVAIRAVQRACARAAIPPWASPALGGLVMGLLGTGLALWMRSSHGAGSLGFGVFGGGYGVLQAAMSGPEWIGTGSGAVMLLLGVALAKIAASALTIGSGASAGDFAPSLVIGGLVGAAFGVGARAVLGDPSIDPAAFTLVGMGTFYGGLAHAPLSALVLVAELAGSYDLLVPMMLSIAIAYVALRRHTLYPAQVPSRFASAAHRDLGDLALAAALSARTARELLVAPEVPPVDEPATVEAVLAASAPARLQRVVAVRGPSGHTGLVELAAIGEVPAAERHWIRAQDAAVRFAAVEETATWAEVAEVLERCDATQIPVLRDGEVVGWVGDRELRRAVLRC